MRARCKHGVDEVGRSRRCSRIALGARSVRPSAAVRRERLPPRQVSSARSVSIAVRSSMSVVCAAATTVRLPACAGWPIRRASRRRNARPRSAADAVCSVAPSGRAVSAARRISTEQHGIVLVRHRRRAAAALPSASSPISGLLPVATSFGDVPPCVAAADQRVAGPGDRRPRGVPGRGRRQPTGGASASHRPSAASGDPVSSVAAAAFRPRLPSWTGSGGRAATASAASSTPVSQLAIFAPMVPGSAAWVSVRASMAVCSVGLRSASTSARTCAANSSPMATSTSRTHSISAVSTTSWLVSPRCSQRGGSRRRCASPQQRDQRR